MVDPCRDPYSAVRGSANKSVASAASLDYVNFQAMIKSAASAASLRAGRVNGRLDHVLFFAMFGRAGGHKHCENLELCGVEPGPSSCFCFVTVLISCSEQGVAGYVKEESAPSRWPSLDFAASRRSSGGLHVLLQPDWTQIYRTTP